LKKIKRGRTEGSGSLAVLASRGGTRDYLATRRNMFKIGYEDFVKICQKRNKGRKKKMLHKKDAKIETDFRIFILKASKIRTRLTYNIQTLPRCAHLVLSTTAVSSTLSVTVEIPSERTN